MSIVLNPQTLPFSQMVTSQAEIGSITTMLAYHRARNGTQVSGRISSLIDGTMFKNVEFGSGVINSVTVDLAKESDWTRQSTLLDVNDAPVGQETLYIDTFRKIELSINEVMARQTGVAENQIESLLSAIMQTLENTHSHNQWQRVVDLYNGWVASTTQVIPVPLKATTGLVGADLNQTNEANMRMVYKVMQETVERMLVLSTDFTDIKQYEDQDGVLQPVRRSMAEDSMRLVLNSKYNTLMQADGLAPIYNQTTLASLKAGRRLDIITQMKIKDTAGNLPTAMTMTPVNNEVIGWLHENDKFALITFYLLTRSFADGSNLFTNYWLHYAFGMGVFGLLMGVKFVAQVS